MTTMSVFLQRQGLSVDRRLPDPCNMLLYEPAVLARLSEKGSQLRFKMVFDPNDWRYLYWYTMVVHLCDAVGVEGSNVSRRKQGDISVMERNVRGVVEL